MKAPAMLRTLTLWGWALIGAGVLILVLLVLQGLGFRWDPLGLAERRTHAAEARASVAVADASARRFEVEGAAGQIRRLDEVHQQTLAVERMTAQTMTQAGRALDADTPIEPDRAARLLRHDSELCRLAPAVCNPAAIEPSTRRDEAVRAGTIAAGSNPGGP